MIITNALMACWEVVIGRKTHQWVKQVDLFDDLMGSHTYEGKYIQGNTSWDGDKLNQPTYANVLFIYYYSCIILDGNGTILRLLEYLILELWCRSPKQGLEYCSVVELWDWTSILGAVYPREYKEGVLCLLGL